MLGFLIGTACLIGLVKVLRGGRWGRWGHHAPMRAACGGGRSGLCDEDPRGFDGRWGHDGYDGYDGYDGPGALLRRLMAGLEVTPDQAKVIREAARELRESAKSLRGEPRATRDDLARVARADVLDENALGDLFTRHDDHLRTMRKAFVGALGRVHAVLDDTQRERLASMLERGRPFGGRPRGPFAWA
jgi:uncharacterized membrane protein